MLHTEKLSLNIPDSTKLRIVVIGGGFAGLNLVKNLPEKELQVVLLDRQNYNGFWPLLYQVATAGLEPDSIAEPLRKIFSKKTRDIYFRLVRVTNINPSTKTITTLLGELSYDYLVIATGSKSNFFGNTQVQQLSFPMKRIPHALNLRSQLLQVLERANMTTDESYKQSLLNIVIAGGGPTGVELAGVLAEMRKHILPVDYPLIDFRSMNIYVIEGRDRLLAAMSPDASRMAKKYLEKMGIIIKLNTLVSSYDGETVQFKNAEPIATQTLIWAAGVTGALINGLPVESVEKGRILVDPFNRVIGMDNVFALGDIALMKLDKYPNGHPGLAQPAIQQGKHLAKNIRRMLHGKEMEPFKYFDKGSLAIVGRSRAVADLPGNIHLGGLIAWIIWLFVHLSFLVGFRNKMVVVINWIYRFFTYERGNRLIIRPYVQSKDAEAQELANRFGDE